MQRKKKEKRRKEYLLYTKARAWELLYEAEEAAREKKKDLAIQLLRKSLRIYPQFLEGYVYLGFLYIYTGDYKSALRTLLVAKRINPRSHELYYYLGLAYVHLDMLKEAIESYKFLLSLMKEEPAIVDKKIKKEEIRERISILKSMLKDKKRAPLFPQEELPSPAEKKKEKKEELQETEEQEIPLNSLLANLKISKSFAFIKNDSLFKKLSEEKYEPFRWYELRVKGNEILLLKGFDRLLCLNQIRNVKKFWYQIETVKKTLKYFRGRVLLCDEVGLGKTVEAGMILKEYLIRGLVRKVLILVPPSLIVQWKDEMASKFDIKFVTTDDKSYQEEKNKFWTKHSLIISSINIAKARKNFKIITGIDYDMIIVDEAHHLKNRNSLNWKFVNSLRKKFILLLTATPIHNNLMELYNLITLLKPGQLKTPSSFRKSFVLRGDPRIPKNRERLRELLSETMIRNTRSLANIDLPKRYATTIKIRLDDDEGSFYEALTNFVRERCLLGTLNKFTASLLQMEAGSSPFAVRSTLLKLREAPHLSSRALRETEDLVNLSNLKRCRKVEKLIEILSKTSEKVIVFTNYLPTQKFLAERLTRSGIEYSLFNGHLSVSEKEKSINLFQKRVKVLISTEIGGEGKNLHFCNTMINYDLPWNPMRIEQRIGRIHRIGQKRDVFIFNLSAQGTVEDYILQILDEKINMFQLVLGETEMILGNLDKQKDFSEIIMDIWLQSSDEKERKKGFEELGSKLVEAKKRYLEVKKYDEEILQHDYEL